MTRESHAPLWVVFGVFPGERASPGPASPFQNPNQGSRSQPTTSHECLRPLKSMPSVAVSACFTGFRGKVTPVEPLQAFGNAIKGA